MGRRTNDQQKFIDTLKSLDGIIDLDKYYKNAKDLGNSQSALFFDLINVLKEVYEKVSNFSGITPIAIGGTTLSPEQLADILGAISNLKDLSKILETTKGSIDGLGSKLDGFGANLDGVREKLDTIIGKLDISNPISTEDVKAALKEVLSSEVCLVEDKTGTPQTVPFGDIPQFFVENYLKEIQERLKTVPTADNIRNLIVAQDGSTDISIATLAQNIINISNGDIDLSRTVIYQDAKGDSMTFVQFVEKYLHLEEAISQLQASVTENGKEIHTVRQMADSIINRTKGISKDVIDSGVVANKLYVYMLDNLHALYATNAIAKVNAGKHVKPEDLYAELDSAIAKMNADGVFTSISPKPEEFELAKSDINKTYSNHNNFLSSNSSRGQGFSKLQKVGMGVLAGVLIAGATFIIVKCVNLSKENDQLKKDNAAYAEYISPAELQQKIEDGVNAELAKYTDYISPADLENAINKAIDKALLEYADYVSPKEKDEAIANAVNATIAKYKDYISPDEYAKYANYTSPEDLQKAISDAVSGALAGYVDYISPEDLQGAINTAVETALTNYAGYVSPKEKEEAISKAVSDALAKYADYISPEDKEAAINKAVSDALAGYAGYVSPEDKEAAINKAVSDALAGYAGYVSPEDKEAAISKAVSDALAGYAGYVSPEEYKKLQDDNSTLKSQTEADAKTIAELQEQIEDLKKSVSAEEYNQVLSSIVSACGINTEGKTTKELVDMINNLFGTTISYEESANNQNEQAPNLDGLTGGNGGSNTPNENGPQL